PDRIVLPDLPRVRIVLNESLEGVGTVVVAPLCRIAGRSARAFDVLDVPRARRYEVETPDRDDVVDIHIAPSVEILVSEARHVALRSDIRDQRVTGTVDVRPDEVVELALRCGRLDHIESSGVPVLIDRADHVTELPSATRWSTSCAPSVRPCAPPRWTSWASPRTSTCSPWSLVRIAASRSCSMPTRS